MWHGGHTVRLPEQTCSSLTPSIALCVNTDIPPLPVFSGHSHPSTYLLRCFEMFRTLGEISVLRPGQEPPPQLDHHQPRPLVRLYCLNGGHHLRILPDGTVGGGRLEHDIYDTLRLKAVRPGVVVIRGEATERYLAMDQDGRLYGSQQVVGDECYFVESYEENHYNTYGSQGRPGWYVGLKRSGEAKTGPATQRHQKAVYFLPRPVSQP